MNEVKELLKELEEHLYQISRLFTFSTDFNSSLKSFLKTIKDPSFQDKPTHIILNQINSVQAMVAIKI